ncbi:hypothetical protein [Helicobacter labacensis]|uniref:hypothetical protein n=1 Tax=Helicobacter labacensis TaxID=2316079 RepID=UPI000EB05C68|nr:hypothetical protein [Helicobacter labacensis]
MKLAKFALTCDGEKITSLEQLKEHFNLLDVLEHYKTKTLWRWLRSRGYQNELAGIEAITATQDTEILSALCGVFGIEADLQVIQETPKNHQRMQENEVLKAELKACKEQLQALQATPPVSAPNFGDYFKSYNALKEKFFNAQDFESGKAILKELDQNYTELFEMNGCNIITPLHAKVLSQRDAPSLEHIFLLCLLVHFWGFRLPEDYGDIYQYPRLDFQDIAHFTQPERLMIPQKGKVHTFEKVVCINRTYTVNNGGLECRFGIERPRDIEADKETDEGILGTVLQLMRSLGPCDRETDKGILNVSRGRGSYCASLKGVVEITRGDSTDGDIPLFYIEIGL